MVVGGGELDRQGESEGVLGVPEDDVLPVDVVCAA